MPLHLVAATHILAGCYHVLTQVPYLLLGDDELGTISAGGSRLQGAMEKGLTTAFAMNIFRSQIHLHLLLGVLLLCVGFSRSGGTDDARRQGRRLPSGGSVSKYSSSSSQPREEREGADLMLLPSASLFRTRATGIQMVAALAALLFWGKGVPGVWHKHPILPEWDVYGLDNPVSYICTMFSSMYTLSVTVEVYQYCRRYVR